MTEQERRIQEENRLLRQKAIDLGLIQPGPDE